MQHIDEIKGLPTVGETYFVKSIEATCGSIGKQIVPVVGTFHEDAKLFDVEWKHWHFDARFVSGILFDWILQFHKEKHPHSILGYATAEHDVVSDKSFMHPFECVRQTPVFRLNVCADMTIAMQKRLPYDRRKLVGDCLKCPHRGTQLSGVEPHHGVVVCPAHGLAFDVETKKMVNRSYQNDPAKCVM